MKSSSDSGSMRCYRLSKQGILVGMAEYSNVERWAPVSAITEVYCFLRSVQARQHWQRDAQKTGQGSKEPSGGPQMAHTGDAAALHSEPASCPHKEGTTPVFL